jgi:hypothetical protein
MRCFVLGGYSRKLGWEAHGWRNSEMGTEFKSRVSREQKCVRNLDVDGRITLKWNLV